MGEFFARKKYEQATPGTTQGVCCDVRRFENVEKSFEGKKKTVDEQRFYFEIPEVNPETGRRFVVSRAYTEAWGDRANLPKVLAALMGKAVSREDIDAWKEKGFQNYRLDMLGKNALLSLITSKDGEYTNIDTVTPAMVGMTPLLIKDHAPESEDPIPF